MGSLLVMINTCMGLLVVTCRICVITGNGHMLLRKDFTAGHA